MRGMTLTALQVACETATKTNMVMIFGEITTKAKVDYEKVVRDTVRNIGFTSDDVGIDADKMNVLVNIEEQSPDIGQGVHGMGTKTLEETGNLLQKDVLANGCMHTQCLKCLKALQLTDMACNVSLTSCSLGICVYLLAHFHCACMRWFTARYDLYIGSH